MLSKTAIPLLVVDAEAGLLREARQLPSPNCDARPPGAGLSLIIVHGTALQHVPDSYRRYLEHFFSDAFKLRGTPLRIQFKVGANPYADSPARRR